MLAQDQLLLLDRIFASTFEFMYNSVSHSYYISSSCYKSDTRSFKTAIKFHNLCNCNNILETTYNLFGNLSGQQVKMLLQQWLIFISFSKIPNKKEVLTLNTLQSLIKISSRANKHTHSGKNRQIQNEHFQQRNFILN